MKTTTIKDFGKDHWSLLAYCEYRSVNHKGVLAIEHLRCKHPAIATTPFGQNLWKPEYGTRLKGYWDEQEKTHSDRMILDHDDFDCLDDLEAAGLLKNVGTIINPYAELTEQGQRVAALLNVHKQNGGQFSNFNYEEETKTNKTRSQKKIRRDRTKNKTVSTVCE